MEFIVIVALLGVVTGAIAHNKGHSFAKWWFYGAALFIVALPMAIMLKPVGQVTGAASMVAGLRKCPKCSESIQPDAKVCRFCGAAVTPITAEERKKINAAIRKEQKKAAHVPGWLVVVVFVVFGFFVYAMVNSTSNRGGGSSTNPINSGLGGILASDYTIRVTGTDGSEFSGSYMLVTADGQSQSKTVDGVVPAEYRCRGSIVSTTFQKQAEGGRLKVQIFKGSQLVNESETTAAYGVVSAASN
jgi:hypothetical protein